jgi:hypothetical protein
MTGRGGVRIAAALFALASSAVACSSDFDANDGACRMAGLGLTTPMTSIPPPSPDGTDPTAAPADSVVVLTVSNAMSETKDRVVLSVSPRGVAVATGRNGGGTAQLDPEAMVRLTRCLTDSGFTDLAADYPDQMSKPRTDGTICGVADASTYRISVRGIAGPKSVSAYGLDLDRGNGRGSSCDLGHPQALQQVYAGLMDLHDQVTDLGH